MAYRLRPSKMALTVACTGSVSMQEQYPDEAGPEAAEGTAAHECFAALLQTGAVWPAGHACSNGVIVSEDMREAAQLAADVVAAWDIPVHIEQPMSCAAINDECGGTPDVWGYDYAQRLIRLADFKYGYGIVDVFENWQLLTYLAGALRQIGTHDLETIVEFTIIQPRASHPEGPVRTWRFKASDVRAHFNIMRAKTAEALSPAAKCTPGDHCGDCSASNACPTLQRGAYHAMSLVGKPEPFDLAPAAAARELKRMQEAKAMLDARIDGLEVRVAADIRKGVQNAFFVIENVNARRRWVEGMEEAAIGIAAAMGKDIVAPRRAITPTQAMKLLDRQTVESLSYKPVGEAKLVKFDIAKTRKLFGA